MIEKMNIYNKAESNRHRIKLLSSLGKIYIMRLASNHQQVVKVVEYFNYVCCNRSTIPKWLRLRKLNSFINHLIFGHVEKPHQLHQSWIHLNWILLEWIKIAAIVFNHIELLSMTFKTDAQHNGFWFAYVHLE